MFLTQETVAEEVREMILVSRNPLKSGQCFLLEPVQGRHEPSLAAVAIPSNRVNVSYLEQAKKTGTPQIVQVAIPSNRVNVSYAD